MYLTPWFLTQFSNNKVISRVLLLKKKLFVVEKEETRI